MVGCRPEHEGTAGTMLLILGQASANVYMARREVKRRLRTKQTLASTSCAGTMKFSCRNARGTNLGEREPRRTFSRRSLLRSTVPVRELGPFTGSWNRGPRRPPRTASCGLWRHCCDTLLFSCKILLIKSFLDSPHSFVLLCVMAARSLRREKWTLDAWNRAIDWDNAHPNQAAYFIRYQGLEGDFVNLTSNALRCLGFTGLYETGRIEAPASVGGAAGELDKSPSSKSSKYGITLVKPLEDRVASLERKESMLIVVCYLTGRFTPLKVQPSDTIKDIKEHIHYKEGVHPYSLYWNA
jgi:hypothetical protein